jgi:hypothetical protein
MLYSLDVVQNGWKVYSCIRSMPLTVCGGRAGRCVQVTGVNKWPVAGDDYTRRRSAQRPAVSAVCAELRQKRLIERGEGSPAFGRAVPIRTLLNLPDGTSLAEPVYAFAPDLTPDSCPRAPDLA